MTIGPILEQDVVVHPNPPSGIATARGREKVATRGGPTRRLQRIAGQGRDTLDDGIDVEVAEVNRYEQWTKDPCLQHMFEFVLPKAWADGATLHGHHMTHGRGAGTRDGLGVHGKT